MYIFAQVILAQVILARSLRSQTMRRRPIFFGTPAKPCGGATGSFSAFSYADDQFPLLTSGSEQARCSNRSYIHAVLHGSQSSCTTSIPGTMATTVTNKVCPNSTTTAIPSMPPTLPPTNPFTTMRHDPTTRKDAQFYAECARLDAQLESSQFEAAKAILNTMDPKFHDGWLHRLSRALKKNIPMVAPITSAPMPKRPLYKKNIIFYHDTIDLPQSTMADGYAGLHSADDLTPFPKQCRYNFWTDLAIAVYGTKEHDSEDHVATISRRRRVIRPSSYVRLSKAVEPGIPTLQTMDQDHRDIYASHSKHTFQYSSYDQQHGSYLRYLSDETPGLIGERGSLTYLLRTTGPPTDATGKRRWQRNHFERIIELSLQQELQSTTQECWTAIVDKYLLYKKFQQSMLCHPTSHTIPTLSPLRQHLNLPSQLASVSTGIAHFPRSHRLWKRHYRSCAFRQTMSLRWDKSAAISTLSQAPPVGHPSFWKFLSAPLFGQHGIPYLNHQHILPVLFSFDASAPNFGLHNQIQSRNVLHFLIRAPLLRQSHEESSSSLREHYDVQPPPSVPYDASAPIFRLRSHLANSFFSSSCHLGNNFLTEFFGICSRTDFPYGTFERSFFGLPRIRQQTVCMGILVDTYCGISSLNLFPHTQKAEPVCAHTGSFVVESMYGQKT